MLVAAHGVERVEDDRTGEAGQHVRGTEPAREV
jgi:hypothetical protein